MPDPAQQTDPVPSVFAAPVEAIPDDDIALEDRHDLHLDDPDDTWLTGPAKRGINLRIPTAALLVLIAVAGGFWGGAVAEKHHGSGSSAASSIASRFASLRGGATGGFGGTGAAGFGGATGGAATTGIVTAVKGSTLYITNASGNLVQVTLAPSGTISETVTSGLSGLKPGDTVVIRGTTGTNGTVAATSITEGAPVTGGSTTGGTTTGGPSSTGS